MTLRLLTLTCALASTTVACVTPRSSATPDAPLLHPTRLRDVAPPVGSDVAEWNAWADGWSDVPEVRPAEERLFLSELAAQTLPDQEVGDAGPSVRSVVGEQIASRATRWVGFRSLHKVTRKVPDDCSGLVRLAYERAGVPVLSGAGQRGENAVSIIWRHASRMGALHRGVPVPGDLVFFRETYDRNRDRRRNDGLTHIGIVERVDADGTVTFIHRGGQGVLRGRLNVQHPQRRADDDGRVLNDYIRHVDPKVAHAPRLAGELWSGFASVEKLERSADDADVAREGTDSSGGQRMGAGTGDDGVPETDRVGARQRRHGGDG